MTCAGYIRSREEAMPGFFGRFYAVGLLLWLLPPTRGLFVAITSLSLVVTVVAAFFFHRAWSRRTVVWFAFIVISSFALEWAGVRDARIFGAYGYGPGLAPLIGGTPLVIGLNWLWLVYAAHDLSARAVRSPLWRVLVGSIVLVVYDLALEWAAGPMQMWRFEGGYAPVRNFAVWFAVGLLYLGGFEALAIRSDNRPARMLFVIQFLFFLSIGLLAHLFPA